MKAFFKTSLKVIENVTRSSGVPFRTKWRPFCPKPLEIQTRWPLFCSDFQWLGFRMVRTIAIAIALIDHSETIGNRNFKLFGIPMFGIQEALTVQNEDFGMILIFLQMSRNLWQCVSHFLSQDPGGRRY